MNLARLLMIDLSGPRLTADERAFLSERRPGGVCLFGRNVADRFQVASLVAEMRTLAGPQLIVTVDQEGGGVVRITDLPYPPSAMALGAADDLDLTRAVARATGHGLRSVGIDVDLAPVADVNSNPANPVIADRAFGSQPRHVARHVVAFVEGLQAAGVAATVKHFPGHGDAALDSHLALPTLTRSVEQLEQREWPPFIAAFAAGVAAVMTAHIVLSAVDSELPATLSRRVITGLLRERLGFDGVVFSDALDMKSIADRWGGAQSAVLALAAGVDMPANVAPLAVHEQTVVAIERAVADGRLDPEALAASAARLDRLRDGVRVGPQPAPAPGESAFPNPNLVSARHEDVHPVPDPASAWRGGAAELLDEAARRALVGFGEVPRLESGARVVLVAAKTTRQSAATQATVSPSAGLAAALRERGVTVSEVPYEPATATSAVPRALQEAERADLLVLASTTRTTLTSEEVELGAQLARARTPFLHVALWNPYVVSALPGPALVTFGWRERSVRAAAAALLGETPVTAEAPVPLAPIKGSKA